MNEAKWYSIEIAPLNEPILVYQPGRVGGVFFVAILLDDPILHWKGQPEITPTHWTRLPQAPEVQ